MTERVRSELALSGPAVSELEGVPGGLVDSNAVGAPGLDCVDALLAALCEVSRVHGREVDGGALIAGLPLVDGLLPLTHIEAAADRAGLVALVTKEPIAGLPIEAFPVIAFLDGNGVVVHGWADAARTILKVGRPAISSSMQDMRAGDLQALACGASVVRLRPVSRRGADEGSSAAAPHWFLSAFRESASAYGVAILATLAINVLALALPLYTMNIYDRVVPNGAVDTLWALTIGVVLATLLDTLVKTLRTEVVEAVGRRADVRLANAVFARLVGARMKSGGPSAGYRASILRELETLRELFSSVTLTALGDLPFLVVYLVAIAVIAGPLVAVIGLAIPLMLATGLLTERALGRHAKANNREVAAKQGVVVETLVALESLKACGGESAAAERWERAVADNVRTGLAMRVIANRGANAVTLISGLVQIATVVTGFYMVAAGSMTSGALIAAMMLAGRALAPLTTVAMMLTRLQMTRQAYATLAGLAGAEQERPHGAHFINKTEFAGTIRFDAVSLVHEGAVEPSLRDVTFAIKPGERVGVIGGVGSGKTTLLRLIAGLTHASGGRVLVDDLAVDQIDPAVLRRRAGICVQGGELISGTLRSNISLGRGVLGDAAVLRAADMAGAGGFIRRLPRGLDTVVRERGEGLSRGQKQCVALARALAGDPDMLLLDEPTSDMDVDTERHVVGQLARMPRHKSMLVVTHRPALLALVDRLIVVDGGRIVADGPKAEVLARLGRRADGESAGTQTLHTGVRAAAGKPMPVAPMTMAIGPALSSALAQRSALS